MDWAILGLVLAFGLRGWLHGLISQSFAVVGLAAGLWVAGGVAASLGRIWQGGEPAVAYGVLRWVVAGTAALALSSLLHWWGESLGRAVRATPAGWLDRPGGFLLGTALGMTVGVFMMLIALLLPWPRGVQETAARARLAAPMMSEAARACSLGTPYFPGSEWLQDRFVSAARRAGTRARLS